MRIAPAGHRAYTYIVTTPPANPPVTLDTFKQHINVTHSLTDGILQLYLDAAIQFAERYTGRYLITRTFSTFRDFFPNPSQNEGYYPYGRIPTGATTLIPSTIGNVGFEIRRSPLQSVNSITYTDNSGNPQTVDPTTYYNTVEEDYSEILLAQDSDWPTDANNRMQSIDISFVCGLGNDETEIEACWKVAIMEHAAMLWANRGDCSDSGCMKMIPAASKAFYEIKRLRNL